MADPDDFLRRERPMRDTQLGDGTELKTEWELLTSANRKEGNLR